MTIHDQSYRRYTGVRETPGAAWLVIALTGIRSALGKKLFLWVMLAAWGQFFVRAVIFYLSANFPNMDLLAPSAETFRQFFEMQGIFVFFVTIYVGSGLIANDRRSNALQIYLAKPLTRAEYVAGKLGILLFFLLLVTLLPAVALLLVQIMFSASLTFLRENLFLIPAITLYALLEVLLNAFVVLALSSLSNSVRYTAMLYAGAVFFTDIVFNIVRAVTSSTALAWLSYRANLEQLGDVIFRLQPRHDVGWLLSVFAVVTLIGLSLFVLERRVRGVEVVT
jgi:ABC-type transport system involved in multi-copper enzyme maturation permease subunit